MAHWDVMEDRLRELVLAKCSGSQIAQALNEEFGAKLTRSAVIGRASRMGLSLGVGRIAPVSTSQGPKRKRKPKPPAAVVAPTAPEAQERAPDPAPIVFPMHKFEDLEPEPALGFEPGNIINMRDQQCRWIEGDALEGLCCGAKVKFNSSWCPEHHARVFTPYSRAPRPYSAAEAHREQMRRALMKMGAR